MTKFDKIKEFLDDLDDGEKVYFWNEYCDAASRYDDRIEYMAELPELFSVTDGDDLFNLLNRFYFGHDENDDKSSANPNREYFYFNGYGNIVSTDYPGDVVELDELAEFILDRDEDFNNDDLREILDEDESGEDEE